VAGKQSWIVTTVTLLVNVQGSSGSRDFHDTGRWMTSAKTAKQLEGNHGATEQRARWIKCLTTNMSSVHSPPLLAEV
jgi:predicted alpha/beta hydrolase family esterase